MQQTTITQLNLVSSSRANAYPRSFLPCSLPQRQAQRARREVQIRAQQQQQQTKPEVAKFADSVGLPTEEGLFGFKPFPEVRHHASVPAHLCLLCNHVVQLCPCTHVPKMGNTNHKSRLISETVKALASLSACFTKYWHVPPLSLLGNIT